MLRRSKSIGNLSSEDEQNPWNGHESRRLSRFENPQPGRVKINRMPPSSQIPQPQRRRVNLGPVNDSGATKRKQTECIYEGIPLQLLYCSFCDKKFNSPRCFEEHIEDESHRRRMASLPSEFSVDIQRYRDNIYSAMKGRATKYDGESTEYCMMCKVYCPGSLSEHRQWILHRELKKFLHPECTVCHISCKTRSEYCEHTLTPGHLRNLAKDNGRKMGNSSQEENGGLEFDVPMRLSTNERQNDVELGESSQADRTLTKGFWDTSGNSEGSNVDAEGNHEGRQNEEDSLGIGSEAANLSTGNESPTHFVDEEGFFLPIYKEHLTYGKFMVEPRMVCVCCKSVLKKNESAEVHAGTRKHYDNYVNVMKRHIRRKQVSEISQKDDSQQLNRSLSEEPDIGRWKRLKKH